jgi:hypothetical protein
LGLGQRRAKRGAVREPRAKRRPRRLVERDEPLLRSLPHHAHHARGQVHVLEVEADELAQAESRCVEELENGAVAPAKGLGRVGHLEQRGHLVHGQMRRDLLLALRRHGERRGIGLNPPLALQVFHERAERGQLARRRRARLTLAVQLTHERANQIQVDVAGREVGLLDVGTGECQELLDVARVRIRRVRGHIAIEGQVVDELPEMILHRTAWTASLIH